MRRVIDKIIKKLLKSGRHYSSFSSSDYRKRSMHKHHRSHYDYGHHHYKRKKKSFFSSFFSS
ncbi:hypothetical protein [Bacillus solimangrovi]|uniref:hypothetical protein n=1 Tax=Bacillus solimangrovi TaxID=1305675 RepID=UPI003CCC1ED4